MAALSVKEFSKVSVGPMVKWIKAIPFEDWPQQSVRELRPAMVSNPDWHDFYSHAAPVVEALGFQATQQWMLSVVMPGHSIEPHQDQQPDYWQFRVHVPLLTNPKAVTEMSDGLHHMEVGKAYKVNTTRMHAVFNKGKTPRVHFMFDVIGG